MNKFRFLEIRLDSQMRVIEIKVENRDIAIKLVNYLKFNWALIFSHDLHGFVIHRQSYGCEPYVNYSTIIDWSGTEKMLTDIYYELIGYTTYDRTPLKIDKYLEFDTCKIVPYLDTDQAYRPWISGSYDFDYVFHKTAAPLSAGIATVKIEQPEVNVKIDTNIQPYIVPGRRNGKGMIMANNNNLEIAHHRYTKAFYAKLANNLYGYQLLSSIDSNNDIRDCIKKVQINEKKKVVTIVWKFGEPTIARCGKNDTWDPEKGLLVCIAKHLFVSGTQMNKWLKEQIPEPESEDYIPKHAKEEAE